MCDHFTRSFDEHDEDVHGPAAERQSCAALYEQACHGEKIEDAERDVLAAQRVNRAALPHKRHEGRGLLVWISSSSCAGGTPAWLAPYFAAKAATDALAVQYARELARWGIETSIIVPGTFAGSTTRWARASQPADAARAAEYDAGPYASFAEQTREAMNGIVPPDADAGRVAGAILSVVDAPSGERPFRIHVNPTCDGAEVALPVVDRVRDEMLRRLGFGDLLKPGMHKGNGHA